jgi:hypothetical protein
MVRIGKGVGRNASRVLCEVDGTRVGASGMSEELDSVVGRREEGWAVKVESSVLCSILLERRCFHATLLPVRARTRLARPVRYVGLVRCVGKPVRNGGRG